MSIISLLLNLLWIVFGGLWMALGWVIAAVVMAITIVGLPWARAAFNIAGYTLLPFGYKAGPRNEYFGHEDVGTGPLGVIGNIVWLLLAGWWLALGHLVTAILLVVTVVGIPFAWAHLKLAKEPGLSAAIRSPFAQLGVTDRSANERIMEPIPQTRFGDARGRTLHLPSRPRLVVYL